MPTCVRCAAQSTFFSHVWTDLPGLNQYQAADKVSCSMTQNSDMASSETQTSNSTVPHSNALPTEPLHSAGWTIVLLRGHLFIISKWYYISLKIMFVLANSADHDATYHLVLSLLY